MNIEGQQDWWRTAVVYQVYPRSFVDSNADGIGDLEGLRSRLSYLADLGVDAIWLNPFYPSPLADGGYDIANYRDVDARLGTLAVFDALTDDAHGVGIKIIVDIVPNHTSDRHPWFEEALAAARFGCERSVYLPRRCRRGRWASAVGLAIPLRGWRLGSDTRRTVVLPPVHPRTAGPQLGQRRGPAVLP